MFRRDLSRNVASLLDKYTQKSQLLFRYRSYRSYRHKKK